jgi:phage N-6-adenine-methyltransferase
MLNRSLFSRNSDDHETPKQLFDFLNSVFEFTLDPCARDTIESQKRIKTEVQITKDDDGLIGSWDNKSTFVNPPYSKISKWIDKAINEYNSRIDNWKKGIKPEPIVLLVPARTDTRWWHKIVSQHSSKVVFIKGRLKFNNGKTNAPFPSCIIIMSPGSTFDRLSIGLSTLIPTWTMDLQICKD